MSKDGTSGERIAKVLARRGIASRRGAETMIGEGRVAVNGKVIDSPALNVGARDRITVDGKPLPEAEPAKLWLYHKPIGLVTTEKDELGRPTVFGALPPEIGRVMSVGRLDLNSEGLLLLTNDGDIKRKLELPSTGWLRKYRVRVNGMPGEATLEPLRQGITLDGERFQPMEVTFDRQQGSNAWLTIGLREGKNREVRRAMEEVGLSVNRLIRVSYGPFRLGDLKPGAVEEVRAKVMRDQLGLGGPPGAADPAKPVRVVSRAGAGRGKPQSGPRATGDRVKPTDAPRGRVADGVRPKSFASKPVAERRGDPDSGKPPVSTGRGKPQSGARASGDRAKPTGTPRGRVADGERLKSLAWKPAAERRGGPDSGKPPVGTDRGKPQSGARATGERAKLTESPRSRFADGARPKSFGSKAGTGRRSDPDGGKPQAAGAGRGRPDGPARRPHGGPRAPGTSSRPGGNVGGSKGGGGKPRGRGPTGTRRKG